MMSGCPRAGLLLVASPAGQQRTLLLPAVDTCVLSCLPAAQPCGATCLALLFPCAVAPTSPSSTLLSPLTLWPPPSPAAAPYTSVSQCVRATLATNGFRGPFQGLGPTILRNTPANAVYLGSFEVFKQKLAAAQG